MPNYQKMYTKLFNKVTDVILELQEIQSQTERLYIESPDQEITLLKPEGELTASSYDEHKRKSPFPKVDKSTSKNGLKHK